MASRVLIVGGGIAGLSTAIALRRAGVEVDVVEADRKWAVDDIGMIVHANFLRAMAALGVAADAIALGMAFEGAALEDFDGNPIPQLSAASNDGGIAYPADLGISRRALHKLLASTVLASGANVRLGVTFTEIIQSGPRAIVTLTDGSVANYDLVVGADGVHSKVRAAVFGTQFKAQFTGEFRWRCMVRRTGGNDAPFVRIRNDGTRYGYMPVSARFGSVMLLDREPVELAGPPERLPQLARARLAGCTGRLAELREQIVDSSAVVCRPIEILFLPAPWYRGRVVLVGDASHTMTAHMAQGAVQAVEDGVVLGDLFASHTPMPQLLEAFMLRRYARCKLIAETTLLMKQADHLAVPVPHASRVTERILAVAASPF